MHIENRFPVPRLDMYMLQPTGRQAVEDTGEGSPEFLFTDRLLLSPEARELLAKLCEKMKGRIPAASAGGVESYMEMLLQSLTPGIFSLVTDLPGDQASPGEGLENSDGTGVSDMVHSHEAGHESLAGSEEDADLPPALMNCNSPGGAQEGGAPPSMDSFLLIMRILPFALRIIQ